MQRAPQAGRSESSPSRRPRRPSRNCEFWLRERSCSRLKPLDFARSVAVCRRLKITTGRPENVPAPPQRAKNLHTVLGLRPLLFLKDGNHHLFRLFRFALSARVSVPAVPFSARPDRDDRDSDYLRFAALRVRLHPDQFGRREAALRRLSQHRGTGPGLRDSLCRRNHARADAASAEAGVWFLHPAVDEPIPGRSASRRIPRR